VEAEQARDSTEQSTAIGSRRSLMAKALLGAAMGVVPSVLLSNTTAAFRSLSGCQKKCNSRFSGKCQTRCRRCCEKIYQSGQQRCSFGCGSIRTK
jgi:hypothetical protein